MNHGCLVGESAQEAAPVQFSTGLRDSNRATVGISPNKRFFLNLPMSNSRGTNASVDRVDIGFCFKRGPAAVSKFKQPKWSIRLDVSITSNDKGATVSVPSAK